MRGFDSRAKVFIAFRLLVCLGRWPTDERSVTSPKVFIAFRLLVCLGHGCDAANGVAMDCLHCLSAFGLFGTRWLDGLFVERASASSLPFGFWSVWDDGLFVERTSAPASLHCLSAFGLFGTMKPGHLPPR